jgi:hypothetical protein
MRLPIQKSKGPWRKSKKKFNESFFPKLKGNTLTKAQSKHYRISKKGKFFEAGSVGEIFKQQKDFFENNKPVELMINQVPGFMRKNFKNEAMKNMNIGMDREKMLSGKVYVTAKYNNKKYILESKTHGGFMTITAKEYEN